MHSSFFVVTSPQSFCNNVETICNTSNTLQKLSSSSVNTFTKPETAIYFRLVYIYTYAHCDACMNKLEWLSQCFNLSPCLCYKKFTVILPVVLVSTYSQLDGQAWSLERDTQVTTLEWDSQTSLTCKDIWSSTSPNFNVKTHGPGPGPLYHDLAT